MKNRFKRILKVSGIAILYLPALIFSCIYTDYIISGFNDEYSSVVLELAEQDNPKS